MRAATITGCVLWPTLAFAQQGAWEFPAFDFGPTQQNRIVAVHLVHVFDGTQGKAVAITYETHPEQSCDPVPTAASDLARLWTFPVGGSPGPGSFEAAPLCRTFMFCEGHCALADGRILNVGGMIVVPPNNPPLGTPQANLFDAAASAGNHWNTALTPPDMAQGRWYPTATTLPDGRVLACAGLDVNGAPVTIPELYTPCTTPPCDPLTTNVWAQLPSAPRLQALYPYMFVLPDGNLVDAGPGESRILLSSSWTWGVQVLNPAWPVPPPPPPGYAGSAVMYEPGKIMRCGGGNPSVDTTWVVKLPTDNPQWLVAGTMNRKRLHHNLVVLPDGKVLAVGGNSYDDVGPVFEAEIFDPTAGTWSLQPPSDPNQRRMYHSSAMLLPDGRVVSAGGDNFATGQIFRPPYITSGAPRPVITAAPAVMRYGFSYTIQFTGPKVHAACLVRLASVTHGFDQDQRRMPLVITSAAPGVVAVAAPADANLAPPGRYMFFILNEYASNQFAPCPMAAYVRVSL